MAVIDRPLQREVALALANEVRSRRSMVKRNLRALPRWESRGVAARLILEPPEHLLSMRTVELLGAVRHVGPVAAQKMLRAATVGSSRPLGELSARQRQVLAGLLRDGTTR